jgi:hypothetical protein
MHRAIRSLDFDSVFFHAISTLDDEIVTASTVFSG